jgi:hypothetical protein
MHLGLDLIFNGELAPRSIVPFYSFAYRLAHRFEAASMFGDVKMASPPSGFWSAFFQGASLADRDTAPAPALARSWPPSKPSC